MSAQSVYDAALLALDDTDPDFQIKSIRAYEQYILALVAEGGHSGIDPDLAINPHFIHDGVRTIARLGSWLGLFYERHKATIDPFLDAALITAFNTLAAKALEMRALNNRGPT